MQTVSERLSQHVLNNYSRFVAGVTEVASVEHDLQVKPISWSLLRPPDPLLESHEECTMESQSLSLVWLGAKMQALNGIFLYLHLLRWCW